MSYTFLDATQRSSIYDLYTRPGAEHAATQNPALPEIMPRFYVTTAINYVNDLPHIGHIYENVAADVIARFRRLMGDEVYFVTGTDEHGQKIERSALKRGITPIELADSVVAAHQELCKTLGSSHNDFIRTTEARHRTGVYELIRRIRERNPDDLYIGEHSGWYCSNEEAFFPESQVSDGKCENGHPVEQTVERNYFFRLSKYEKPLLDYYRSHPAFVQPQTRFNEVTSFVESGLRDLSVSRTAIKWGIPFPDDPDHVVYVWMDALTNYISVLGFGSPDESKFEQFWPADVHLIGKDIVRFHAVYWPAFLMAAGLPLPKSVVTHGWWLRDNQKISKSTGNIVRPNEIIETFGADALRYFLMRDMVFGSDSNYSDEAFLSRYNSDLANDLGNTHSRLVKMSDTYFNGRTPNESCMVNEVRQVVSDVVPEYLRRMEEYAFSRALDGVWRLLDAINGYIVTREPWRRYKEEGASGALSRILWDAMEGMRIVWVLMSPFLPRVAADALTRLGADPLRIGRADLRWGGLATSVPVTVGEPLFPRVDVQQYLSSNTATTTEGVTVEEKAPEQENIQSTKEPAASPAHAGAPVETTQAIAPDDHRISIDQFMELDLRVADVVAAEKVEKSKKLMKLLVSTGDGERTVVAGIATRYSAEELVGRKVVIVANLAAAKLMGIESNGMVLAASLDGEPSLLAVDPNVPAGTKVK